MTGAQETMKTQIVAIYKVTHKSYTLGQPKLLHDDSSKEGPAQARDVVDIKVEGKINELRSNGTGCGNATTSLHTLNAHTLARIL